MSFNVTIRLTGMLLFAAAGLLLGMYLSPVFYDPAHSQNSFNELVLPLTIFGALFGLVVTPYVTIYPARWVARSIRNVPASDLLWGTIGLFVGLVLGALASWPLSMLPEWVGRVSPAIATLVFAVLGGYAGVLRKRDISSLLHIQPAHQSQAEAQAPVRIATRGAQRIVTMDFATGPLQLQTADLDTEDKPQGERYVLLDTSVIIDGRIADISKTGFIDGTLLVPRFVLNELQRIADSPDALRRARGRRGLDMLNKLQKESVAPIQISEIDAEDVPEVDGKLIKIARSYHCSVLTTDFNLNRVAEIQGVKVLNINELANAIKAVVLPGEDMNVRVIQEGKELGQGVGYLDDGTMVVVENGKKYINTDIDVVVTRVLQTVAGRMIFAQMKNGRTQSTAVGVQPAPADQ